MKEGKEGKKKAKRKGGSGGRREEERKGKLQETIRTSQKEFR